MRLYLIRHGETDYNRERIIQGHTEAPLNDAGIAQATRLSLRLMDERIERIISSDLRRAAMTAAIVASHTGAPVLYDPLFRERNPGQLAHRTYEEADRFFTDPAYIPPSGEGVEAFEARVRLAFDSLVAREAKAGGRIAVVSHGMVCRAFLHNQLGVAPEEHAGVRWPNTSLTIADYDGRWHLVVLSDASHLDGLEDDAAAATGA